MWSIIMLGEDDELNPNAYHWDLLHGKCDMQEMYYEKFGFPQL